MRTEGAARCSHVFCLSGRVAKDLPPQKNSPDGMPSPKPPDRDCQGKMRKKVWCNQGDIVLVSLRDFQAPDTPLHLGLDFWRSCQVPGQCFFDSVWCDVDFDLSFAPCRFDS